MTIRFKSRINLPRLQRWVIPGVDSFVKETIEMAARAWVQAAVEKIPVWSGASRATLQALASAVNESVSIDPVSTAPNRIALGRLYSRGGIERTGRAQYNFYYETSLRYLIANETKRVRPRTNGLRGRLIRPTPYNFREAGEKAANAVIEARMKDLPLRGIFGTLKL